MQHSHNEVINIIERLLRFLDVNNICKKGLTQITSSEKLKLLFLIIVTLSFNPPMRKFLRSKVYSKLSSLIT